MEWLVGLGLIAFFVYYVVYKLETEILGYCSATPKSGIEYFQERPEWYINEKPTGVEK